MPRDWAAPLTDREPLLGLRVDATW